MLASGTSVTEVFGVGPLVAATSSGMSGDVPRFPSRDQFAGYNGTAPIEASSGPRMRHRLNPRGNRQLNHAMHMIAITQIRHKHTAAAPTTNGKPPRGRPTRKRCAPQTPDQRRRLPALMADTRTPRSKGPGRTTRERLCLQRDRLHPDRRLFGQVTPGPDTSLRRSSAHAAHADHPPSEPSAKKTRRAT